MIEQWDYFNVYIMGSLEILAGFHFFLRFFQTKVKLIYYIVFVLLESIIRAAFPVSAVAEFFLYILLLMAAGIFIGKDSGIRAALFAVLTVEIMNLCYGVFNSLTSILAPILLSANSKAAGLIFMGIFNISAFIVSVLCYQHVYKCIADDETAGQRYVIMILLPALMIFLVSVYINSNIYGSAVTAGADGESLSADPYQMLLIQILGIASLFCILHAYKKMTESFKLSMKVSLAELEAHSLNQYVEEAKIRYEKTKSFRHDIKNHITIVKELIQNGNTKAALQYMEDMENITTDISFPVSTNNPVLDILLGNKLGIARSDRIEAECSLALPYPCGIRDIDFCIIFSNALDNAITACNCMKNDKYKYIHITGKQQGDFLLIEIKNSYSGMGSIHSGTGLANIRRAAEKYHGAMEIKAEGECVVLSVLVIIPQQPESILQQVD